MLPSARFVAEPHPALHPGRSAAIELTIKVGNHRSATSALQQHYDLPKAPVVFEIDLEPLLVRPLPRHVEISRFQPVLRDISVPVDDAVPSQAMVDAVIHAAVLR